LLFCFLINLEWKNLLLHNRLINMSLSLNKLENDFWLRLVEVRCQQDFIKQIRSNHRRQLISLNEQYQRRVSCIKNIFY
jgi:hypothetical protein